MKRRQEYGSRVTRSSRAAVELRKIGLRPQAIATMIGKSRSYVVKLRDGLRQPSLPVAIKLQELFQIDCRWWLQWVEPTERKMKHGQ